MKLFVDAVITTAQIEDQHRLLGSFRRIGASLLSAVDLDEVLDTVSLEIIQAGVFRSMTVALVDDDVAEVVVVREITRHQGLGSLSGEPNLDRKRLCLRFDLDSSGILAEVARTGSMEVVEGWDDRFDADLKNEGYDDRVSYFIPVCNDERSLAVLTTGSTIAEKPGMLDRIELMAPLLHQAAVAIQHALTYRQLQKEIAEHERAQVELKDSEEKFKLLFENMQNGFALHEMIFDSSRRPRDYLFLEINDAFERIVNLGRNQVVGKRATKIMAPFNEDLSAWIETFGKVTSTGKSISLEYYSETTHRHYSVCAYRPKPGHFATVISDISEKNQLEGKIRMNRNLRSLGLLTGAIAHEFNNMLMGLSMLKGCFGAGSEEQSIARIVEESVRRSRVFARQLMTFATGDRLTE